MIKSYHTYICSSIYLFKFCKQFLIILNITKLCLRSIILLEVDFIFYFFIILSRITVHYICPKCKNKFKDPIEAVLEFEQEDEWNGLPISTPPYIICSKCNFNKCVPIDYVSKRGYHHKYIEK